MLADSRCTLPGQGIVHKASMQPTASIQLQSTAHTNPSRWQPDSSKPESKKKKKSKLVRDRIHHSVSFPETVTDKRFPHPIEVTEP